MYYYFFDTANRHIIVTVIIIVVVAKEQGLGVGGIDSYRKTVLYTTISKSLH